MPQKLLYVGEHLSCDHFLSADTRAFNYYELNNGERITLSGDNYNRLLFVVRGEIAIDCNNYIDRNFRRDEIIFIPMLSEGEIRIRQETEIIIARFDVPKIDCDKLNLFACREYGTEITYDFRSMPVRERMGTFLESLVDYITDGIGCEHLHKIKEEEMFLIFRWYYRKEELAELFYPIIGRSMDFKTLVMKNYQNVDNLNTLARIVGMGRTTFNNTFRDEFGMPPRQWILHQLARSVRNELQKPGATIQDTIIKYKFNSPTHFTRFCKQHLGKTPSQLMAEAVAPSLE